MIQLSNGHNLDFVVASGALAFRGKGWWWERPLVWLGIIKPEQFTIITKTLTYYERAGNLRHWCPWRCVSLIRYGVVNSVSLTNPGLYCWKNKIYPLIPKDGYNIIASVMPASVLEAKMMGQVLEKCPDIKGIEVNVSCPNISHEQDAAHVIDVVLALKKKTKHPVILKLGYTDPYVEIAKELDGAIDAIDAINTVPWNLVYPDRPSPLAKYKLVGGVSGSPIVWHARKALIDLIAADIKTPIISGGGIYSMSEVFLRESLGAKAFSLGTIFLRRPWLPNKIVSEYRKHTGNSFQRAPKMPETPSLKKLPKE